MTKIIPHITDNQSRSLNNTISQIAKETKAGKIICYGVRTNHDLSGAVSWKRSDEAQSMQREKDKA